jgi:hypothetical protein
MSQARIHTWAPDISPKLKSLQYLSIRFNPEVTEEVVHHVVCESMDAFISVCMVAKSSICYLSHLILSIVRSAW